MDMGPTASTTSIAANTATALKALPNSVIASTIEVTAESCGIMDDYQIDATTTGVATEGKTTAAVITITSANTDTNADTLTVTTAGAGYTNPTAIVATDGSCTTPLTVGAVTVGSSGEVTAVAFTAGAGCTTMPTVTIVDGANKYDAAKTGLTNLYSAGDYISFPGDDDTIVKVQASGTNDKVLVTGDATNTQDSAAVITGSVSATQQLFRHKYPVCVRLQVHFKGMSGDLRPLVVDHSNVKYAGFSNSMHAGTTHVSSSVTSSLTLTGSEDSITDDSSGFAGTVTVTGGAVTAVAVTTGGSGFIPGYTDITISGDGSGATATATVDANGAITAITVVGGGTTFTAATVAASNRKFASVASIGYLDPSTVTKSLSAARTKDYELLQCDGGANFAACTQSGTSFTDTHGTVTTFYPGSTVEVECNEGGVFRSLGYYTINAITSTKITFNEKILYSSCEDAVTTSALGMKVTQISNIITLQGTSGAPDLSLMSTKAATTPLRVGIKVLSNGDKYHFDAKVDSSLMKFQKVFSGSSSYTSYLILDRLSTAYKGAAKVTSAGAMTRLQYLSPTQAQLFIDGDGTMENVECGDRGICDTDSGLCKCSAGYSGDACDIQKSIAA